MKTNRKSVLFGGVAVAALGLLFAACGGDDDAGSGASNAQAAMQPTATPTVSKARVQVLDNLFEPRLRSAKVGQTVEWVWDSNNEHSVVGEYDGESIDSGLQKGGGTFSFVFETAGTFEYTCGVHGDSMKGRVIIE